MTLVEQIRTYFRENPGRTLKDCSDSTGIGYETVKQNVWRDHRRQLLSKDQYGGITYQDEFDIPVDLPIDPAKRAVWDMFEILVDRAKATTDDDMLLKFSKVILLYYAEVNK